MHSACVQYQIVFIGVAVVLKGWRGTMTISSLSSLWVPLSPMVTKRSLIGSLRLSYTMRSGSEDLCERAMAENSEGKIPFSFFF